MCACCSRERRCCSLRSWQAVFAEQKRNKEFEEWGRLSDEALLNFDQKLIYY
ncbi:MAG: hypothetical protein Q8O17_03720 [Candidatus Methanoperedens sp.]|nr:hypothetical protein [Candidatus Methanoperedens sp.]